MNVLGAKPCDFFPETAFEREYQNTAASLVQRLYILHRLKILSGAAEAHFSLQRFMALLNLHQFFN